MSQIVEMEHTQINDRTDLSLFSPSYLRLTLFVLFLVNVFNYMDRMVLSVLVQPIKNEFLLSDTQMGLLTGIAFAIFYAVAGIFIARLGDRYNRVNIIAFSILAWSFLTALTGLVQNYLQLFLARIGVGVGEAGAIPTSNSLVSDYFPTEQRSGALGIITSGSSVGLTLGIILGGWIAEMWGWRWAFICVGTPGILLAFLVRSVLRNPPRGYSDGIVEQTAERNSFKDDLKIILGNRLFIQVTLALSMLCFALYGVTQWMPAMLIRTYGLSLSEVGAGFGIALGLGTGAGAFFGGLCTNYIVKKSDKSWLLRVPLWCCLLAFPLYEITIFSGSLTLTLIMLFTVNTICGIAFGPFFAVLMSVTHSSMRATASGVIGFITSLVGFGLGPLVVGILSDRWYLIFEEAALQYAIGACVPAVLLAAVLLNVASKNLEAGLDNALHSPS